MVDDLLASLGVEAQRAEARRAEVRRAEELQRLARRLESCAGRVESVLARCQEIQLLEWKSPAGNAYRDTVHGQVRALRRAVDRLGEARAAVAFRARELPAAVSGSSDLPGWPGLSGRL